MDNPSETRGNVARALAEALDRRGVPIQLIADHGVAVLVPLDERSALWPIWVTSSAVRWRYGHGAGDYDVCPHDGAIDELAARIAETARAVRTDPQTGAQT